MGSFDPSSQTAVASIPHDVHIHNSVSADKIGEYQTGLGEYWKEHLDRRYPIVSPVNGMAFVLVDLDSIEALGRGVTQSREMIDIHNVGLHKEYQPSFLGAYFFVVESARVNAEGVQTLEIRARMFCADVPEDPATGSAACTLAGYLSVERRSDAKDSIPWKSLITEEAVSRTRYRYEITQGVEMGRKSVIAVEVVMKDPQGSEIDQLLLSGQAVKVMEGRLLV